jgi:hypothetical protein
MKVFSGGEVYIHPRSHSDQKVRTPLTTRKGTSPPFAICCCSGLSALTTSLIARTWSTSRTRALMGIAQRGSNRSNDGGKGGKCVPGRGTAYRPICQDH